MHIISVPCVSAHALGTRKGFDARGLVVEVFGGALEMGLGEDGLVVTEEVTCDDGEGFRGRHLGRCVC